MKTMKLLAGAIALLSFLSVQLPAATILTGKLVRVSTPIEGNVYAGAGEIFIEAPVNGDLTAGAGQLTIRDTIRYDLIAGGGRVYIEGVIGDDLRCGGGEVRLSGHVLGDVLVGSGNLEIGRGAVIYGDLVVGGGEVRILGRVMGSVIVAGGEVIFEGESEKDAKVRGGEVTLRGIFRGPCELAAGKLILDDQAEFHQTVRYWQKEGELDFSKNLRGNARATFDTSLKQDMGDYDRSWSSQTFSFFSVYRLLAGALLIAMLLLLFEGFFRRSSEGLPDQWLQRLGTGMLYLFVVPAAAIALCITVIGIPFGLFALLFYAFTLLFAPALTAVVGANALEQYRGLNWTKGQRILVALGLLLALKLVTMIPMLGWLVAFVLMGIAFGCLVKVILTRPAV